MSSLIAPQVERSGFPKNWFQKVWRPDYSEVVPFQSRENPMARWRSAFEQIGYLAQFTGRIVWQTVSQPSLYKCWNDELSGNGCAEITLP